MKPLRQLLRAAALRLLTPTDRAKLAEPELSAADKAVLAEVHRPFARWKILSLEDSAKLAQPLLTPEQLAIMQTLAAPDRWQPDQALTEAEAKAWGSVLASPIGRKIDVAMINIAQQEAQRALLVAPDQLARQAGVALGYRTSWAMAKSLSTLTAADGGKSEDAPSTASAHLEHLAP